MSIFASLPAGARDHPVWLHVGTLLDGTSTSPRRDAHVVYDASGIRFVASDGAMPPASMVREGQTAPDLSLPDTTLLPGLTDAHAHLFLEGGELNFDKRAAYLKQDSATLLAAAMPRLEKLVRLGVVGVRDAGDKDGVGLALSRLCKGKDRPLMPYHESPGAAIHHRGRYGSFMGGALEDYASPAECVASRVADGADRIKLIPTGIINFKKGAVTTEPQMSVDELRQLVAAAKSHGRQTFAHASGDAGIEHVVESGVDSVEHGFFVRDDQLERMRDRGIAWVPTFAPVQVQLDFAPQMGWDDTVAGHLKRILDNHAASLVRAQAMGVTIIAGSDAGSCGVAHGLGLLHELELMEEAGMPSAAVVNAATGAGAGRLAYREKFGRIETGWLPRFIVTNHSPLETVANLRKPMTVVFDGVPYSSSVDTSGL